MKNTFGDFITEITSSDEYNRILSNEEHNELFRRYKHGDYAVFERIVNHNLRLVTSIALKYKFKLKHMEIMDNKQLKVALKLIKRIDDNNVGKKT